MLENIKSSFFIRTIISFLDEKAKLKLVKYNKTLQNMIDINLINYRILSKRYIVYGENGNVEEYSSLNDGLLFEGKYLNGKRNGNGKEFSYNGKLTFDGEYLNGKRSGKGKEFSYKGKLKYEGKYLNGKKEGKGIEFGYDGKSKFEGEFKDGKKWSGKGYDDKNNIIYEIKNGLEYIKEFGILGRLIYEGEYSNGQINGKGKEYDQEGNLEYEGEYKNGIRNGIGKEYYQDNLLFEGQYLDGKCGMEKHMIIKIIKYMN